MNPRGLIPFKIDKEAMEAIRRGWYLGKEGFKDKLLRMLEKVPGRTVGASRRVEGAERDHGEKEAQRIVKEGSWMLGLPLDKAELAGLRKSDVRKIQIAILLRTHTKVSNVWIAQKLAMGHPGSVSRSVADGKADKKLIQAMKKIESVLIRVL